MGRCTPHQKMDHECPESVGYILGIMNDQERPPMGKWTEGTSISVDAAEERDVKGVAHRQISSIAELRDGLEFPNHDRFWHEAVYFEDASLATASTTTSSETCRGPLSHGCRNLVQMVCAPRKKGSQLLEADHTTGQSFKAIDRLEATRVVSMGYTYEMRWFLIQPASTTPVYPMKMVSTAKHQ